jgi:hypothetical protein
MAVAATSGGAVAVMAATQVSSSYRVKFSRREFLELA